MSVIAIKVTDKKITVSADSIVTTGSSQRKTSSNKIVEVNNMLVGSVGLAQERILFQLFCETNRPKKPNISSVLDFVKAYRKFLKKKTNEEESSNDFIIVFDKTAFLISDWFIEEITDYYSIGAGADFASAALYLGHSSKKAVAVACELSIYCEAPIKTLTIKK